MTRLPSPDPERFSKVHVLRRPSAMDSLDRAEEARGWRIRSGRASVHDWEIEAEITSDPARRDHAKKMALETERKETIEALRKARSDASAWRGLAITLAVLLALILLGTFSKPGRGWLNEYYHEAGDYER